MTNQKKQNEGKGVNTAVAAVTGVLVGAAAVGIAGAAALANKGSRKKVEKVIDDAKDKVTDMKKNVKGKIAEGQEKVNKVVSAVKDVT